MRLPLFLLAFAAVFVTAAHGGDNRHCWAPHAQQIAAVEAALASRPLPLGSLDRYVRYYTGTIEIGNHRFIRGKLVPASGEDVSGFHIVEGLMPPLPADGCVTNSRPGHGTWVRSDCAPPGAWPPSDREIAELEETLRLHVPPGELFPGSRSRPSRSQKDLVLQIYARHYAGVTEDYCGKRWPKTTTPFEAEFPHIFDGGCYHRAVRPIEQANLVALQWSLMPRAEGQKSPRQRTRELSINKTLQRSATGHTPTTAVDG